MRKLMLGKFCAFVTLTILFGLHDTAVAKTLLSAEQLEEFRLVGNIFVLSGQIGEQTDSESVLGYALQLAEKAPVILMFEDDSACAGYATRLVLIELLLHDISKNNAYVFRLPFGRNGDLGYDNLVKMFNEESLLKGIDDRLVQSPIPSFVLLTPTGTFNHFSIMQYLFDSENDVSWDTGWVPALRTMISRRLGEYDFSKIANLSQNPYRNNIEKAFETMNEKRKGCLQEYLSANENVQQENNNRLNQLKKHEDALEGYLGRTK